MLEEGAGADGIRVEGRATAQHGFTTGKCLYCREGDVLEVRGISFSCIFISLRLRPAFPSRANA